MPRALVVTTDGYGSAGSPRLLIGAGGELVDVVATEAGDAGEARGACDAARAAARDVRRRVDAGPAADQAGASIGNHIRKRVLDGVFGRIGRRVRPIGDVFAGVGERLVIVEPDQEPARAEAHGQRAEDDRPREAKAAGTPHEHRDLRISGPRWA